MVRAVAFRTLDEWLPWLESLSPREIVLGLERVEAVLEQLGIQRPGLVVTITGTNGKGSSLAILEAILRQSGIRTGAYSSPHVHRYNERTRIDGRPATDATVIAALETVEAARGDTPLTFFEFGTLASLVAFDVQGADAWLLEVGMGGRLDAVNAIDSDGCLITNVALDHCSWLGDDIESIAVEKAGIMRRGKPVVFGAAEVPRAIVEYAAEIGSTLLLPGRDYRYSVAADGAWSWRGRGREIVALPRPALAGDVQLRNASAVLALIEALGIDAALEGDRPGNGLRSVSLEGRYQRIGERWILDVAHNPAAAEVLAQQLDADAADGQVTAIIGMLDDKDVAGFIAPLTPHVDRFVAVTINGNRGTPANVLAQQIANASGKPCRVVPDLDVALADTATQLADNDRVLVAGSFYLVGPAIRWIEGYREAAGASAAAD